MDALPCTTDTSSWPCTAVAAITLPAARPRGRPRKTDAEKAVTKARHAEYMRRKRREDAELRARENEAKRLRRATHPEVRAREAEAMRRKREADAERRAREAEYKRLWRQANPELRATEAEMKRLRREMDPQLRVREAKAAKARRQKDPDLRTREAEARRRLRQACPEIRAREAEVKRLKRRAEAEQRTWEKLNQHVPCLHHSHGQLADHLARVSRMMLPCTCGKDLNGTSSPQHTDSETTAPVIKTEPEEGAPSDEEFFEMPLTVEMRIGKEPSNPGVAVKEESLDIPVAPTEGTGEANEILGVTGIETLVLAAKCQAEQAAENESREPEDVARSTCLT